MTTTDELERLRSALRDAEETAKGYLSTSLRVEAERDAALAHASAEAEQKSTLLRDLAAATERVRELEGERAGLIERANNFEERWGEALAERDAATARAEAAERERDEALERAASACQDIQDAYDALDGGPMASLISLADTIRARRAEWTAAAEARAEALRGAIEQAAHAHLCLSGGNRWVCAACNPEMGTYVDEDGCCTSCGADAKPHAEPGPCRCWKARALAAGKTTTTEDKTHG